MINNINGRNIYKERNISYLLMKKGFSITLDEDILNSVDEISKKTLAKRSTIINDILKEHFKNNKKIKK
ncbi:MAG: hypothetical protein V1663_05705 [archaeon]